MPKKLDLKYLDSKLADTSSGGNTERTFHQSFHFTGKEGCELTELNLYLQEKHYGHASRRRVARSVAAPVVLALLGLGLMFVLQSYFFSDPAITVRSIDFVLVKDEYRSATDPELPPSIAAKVQGDDFSGATSYFVREFDGKLTLLSATFRIGSDSAFSLGRPEKSETYYAIVVPNGSAKVVTLIENAIAESGGEYKTVRAKVLSELAPDTEWVSFDRVWPRDEVLFE